MFNEMDLMIQYEDFINEQHDVVVINDVEYLATEILKRNQESYREGFLAWCADNDYFF